VKPHKQKSISDGRETETTDIPTDVEWSWSQQTGVIWIAGRHGAWFKAWRFST